VNDEDTEEERRKVNVAKIELVWNLVSRAIECMKTQKH
jgi:hypothetical protein